MLLDFINYTSERGFIQDPDYPEVWHIEAHDLTRLEYCPYPDCKEKLTSRDSAEQLHKIHDYDIRTKNVIRISLYRKNYRCTKCKRSCTVSEELNSLSRTDDFDRYIALEAIRGSSKGLRTKSNGIKVWSNEVLGQRYGYKKDTITKIVRARAPAMTPLFIPFQEYEMFYIYPFKYKSVKRYYLLACDLNGRSMVLGVFGYHDADAELITYFELHKEFFSNSEELLITSPDNMELITALRSIFGYEAIVIYREDFEKRFQKFRDSLNGIREKERDRAYTFTNVLVNQILKQDKEDIELLHNWWKEVLIDAEVKNLWKLPSILLPLREDAEENYKFYHKTWQNSELIFPEMDTVLSSINKQIKVFSQNGPDFTVLAARIMLCSKEQILHLMGNVFIYTADIFTSGQELEEHIKGKINSKGEFKAHAFAELLYDAFNRGDISEMIVDSFWTELEKEKEQENVKDVEKTKSNHKKRRKVKK